MRLCQYGHFDKDLRGGSERDEMQGAEREREGCVLSYVTKREARQRSRLCPLLLSVKELDIVAVAFCRHASTRDEAEGCTIDAVAESAEFLRTIIEDMTEMGIAFDALDFGTYHPM